MKSMFLKCLGVVSFALTVAVGSVQAANFTVDTGTEPGWQLDGSLAPTTTHDGWIAPDGQSSNSWIGFGDGAANTLYTYTLSFSLTAEEVASNTASLTGFISVDDSAVVKLNGNVIADIVLGGTPVPWKELVAFSATSGAFLVDNVLEIVVNNSGSGPTGLLISNSVVSAVPLPAAAWLFGSALLGLVTVARRRKVAA